MLNTTISQFNIQFLNYQQGQQWPGQNNDFTTSNTQSSKQAGGGAFSSEGQSLEALFKDLYQLMMQFFGGGGGTNAGLDPSSNTQPGVGQGGGHHRHACCTSDDNASGTTDDASDQTSGKRHGTSSKSHDCTDPSAADSSNTSGSSNSQYALAGPTTPGKQYEPGKNPKIDQWKGDIDKAAALTGLDGNLIGGQMWAESRGNAKEKSTNVDGTSDLGLMQIGQRRWKEDVLPTLTPEDRANIKRLTGKDAKDLDVSNPHDNVIAGAFELKAHIMERGGNRNNPMANETALKKGLADYVGVGDESKYANNVFTNFNVLNRHQVLDDSQ
jgi:hypothetical protein